MAIVPALMQLFGSANWWYPKWLDRITPHISVDPADEDIPVGPEPELSEVR